MTEEDYNIDDSALEHATEVTVSAGRKRQLEQFEPIDTNATITLEFPESASVEEKTEAIENAEEAAWETCERSLARRYEEYVREEAFGDD